MRVELSAPAWATHLLSDLTDWRRAPLPVGELAPFDLPDDAYFEYAWRDEDGEPRPDPDNSNPRLNPWWPHACNLTGPVYEPDPYAVRARDSRARGRTLRLETDSALLGQKRRLLVYSPAGCADRKLPYVVFQDGKAYYGWGRVPRVMDLLLDEGGIAPAHLIFVPPVERTAEYAFNPLYRRFICDEVLPLVARRVPWTGRATAWGASLGGLLSAQLAWERSDIFHRVVAQSGAFQFSEDMDFNWPFGGGEAFLHQVVGQVGPLPDIDWYLECGTLEWLRQSNVNLAEALRARGVRASLKLRHAGHNWVNWSNGIAAGLRAVLGDRPGDLNPRRE